MTHLFQNFLTDEAQYAQAEIFWAGLWADVSEEDRRRGGWRCGWFPAQPLKDGNPIFTAVSESERKAIRVIQYHPTCQEAELDFWLDTFGGTAGEPQTIREMVIACALSVEASQLARKLMASWVSGDEVNLVNAADASVELWNDGAV